MKKSVVISLSGGMDSTTILAWFMAEGYNVSCLAFDYGSKHGRYELKSSLDIAKFYDVPLILFDLRTSFINFDSALLKSGPEIPEGHYEDPSMNATIVPCRNMIMLSYLAGYAQTKNIKNIGIGIHKGDWAIYPDCRVEFFESMEQSINLSTDGAVKVQAPFLYHDKTRILKWGVKHNVPYILTRTCYKDQELSCGKCGSCTERLEAFKNIGRVDPIHYEGE